MMKKVKKNTNRLCIYALIACAFVCVGCESLRFAPSEQQKQNAWLHNRTALVAAEAARDEDASERLQALTELSELQSRAFISYNGLPNEFPKAETADDILIQSNWQLAKTALVESADRPDTWQVADSALELGIAISALLGGVYGTKAVKFLNDARTKSKALREIIEGNELFKQQNESAADAFKQAQQNQSPTTKAIVAELKA
jgi:hypothetical protein